MDKKLKDIKLIIFDLDGTLINAYPAIFKSVNYVLKQLGLRRQDMSAVKKRVGWGDRSLVSYFVGQGLADRALKIYRKAHKLDLLTGAKLLTCAKATLDYLYRKKYKLAIATNRPTKYSWIIIRHLKLAKYFKAVVCADKLKKGKPNPEILKFIMKKLHIRPKNTVFIGDMAIDAQTARRAQVKTIIVTTGSSSKMEIRKETPFLIVDSLKKVRDVL